MNALIQEFRSKISELEEYSHTLRITLEALSGEALAFGKKEQVQNDEMIQKMKNGLKLLEEKYGI